MESDAPWEVLVAAPGRVLRRACSEEHESAIVAAITKHGAQDGAWSESIAGDWVVHGLGRLGYVAAIAAPAGVLASEVSGYLRALLVSYGVRFPEAVTEGSGSGSVERLR